MSDNSKMFGAIESDSVERIIKESNKTISRINLFARYLGAFAIIASLILSPFLFGFMWFTLVTHEGISSAIIGVTCGLLFDFFIFAIILR